MLDAIGGAGVAAKPRDYPSRAFMGNRPPATLAPRHIELLMAFQPWFCEYRRPSSPHTTSDGRAHMMLSSTTPREPAPSVRCSCSRRNME